MFSNGSQYDTFMERNCEQCPFYVYFEEATKEKPICSIEERIALSSIVDKEEALKTFPYEWLDENGTSAVYTCRKRMGKKLKFKTTDHLPKYNSQQLSDKNFNDIFKHLKRD